jgi:hypothetical protein
MVNKIYEMEGHALVGKCYGIKMLADSLSSWIKSLWGSLLGYVLVFHILSHMGEIKLCFPLKKTSLIIKKSALPNPISASKRMGEIEGYFYICILSRVHIKK